MIGYRDLPCGEAFCGACGDCLHCYGGDPCHRTDDGEHIYPPCAPLPETPKPKIPSGAAPVLAISVMALLLSCAHTALADPFTVGTTPCGDLSKVQTDVGPAWQVTGCPALERCLGEQRATPTPVVTATPRRTPLPAPTCRSCPAGQRCVPANCDAFGDCGCHQVLTPTPVPTATPIVTSAPTATPRPRDSWRIAGTWFGGSDQGLLEAWAAPVGSKLAPIDWWDCTPHHVDDAPLEAAVRARLAAGDPPRCWVAEPSTFGWCEAYASALRRSIPETVTTGDSTNDEVTARIANLRAWGVKDLAVAPYTFGWRMKDGTARLRYLFPALFPASWKLRPGAMQADGGQLDFPDATVVAQDAACFSLWLGKMRAQHPEITYVVAQLSNGGNAYGYQGQGYGIASALADALAAQGFPRALQLEAANGEKTGTTWASPAPYADCPMLCAAEKAGASVTVFSADLYGAVKDQIEGCGC